MVYSIFVVMCSQFVVILIALKPFNVGLIVHVQAELVVSLLSLVYSFASNASYWYKSPPPSKFVHHLNSNILVFLSIVSTFQSDLLCSPNLKELLHWVTILKIANFLYPLCRWFLGCNWVLNLFFLNWWLNNLSMVM